MNVRVGSATIRLLPGSSLEVEGNVSIGDLKAKGLDAVERGLGGWGKGLLSNGSADSSGRQPRSSPATRRFIVSGRALLRRSQSAKRRRPACTP